MKKQRWSWGKAYLALVFVILYAPILYLVVFSFSSGQTMEKYHGFSWQHYADLLADTRMITIVINTLLVAFLASLLATIIGTLGALAIKDARRPWKNSLLSLNNVLMVSPDVIIGASFLIFFTMLGVRLGFVSVLLSHIAFCIPIVVLMVLPKLNEMSPTLVDAAYDLGASRWQVLSRVILPSIAPGIFAGYFMAFTYSLDDFAVTFFVTGNGFSTLSVEIYSRARQGIIGKSTTLYATLGELSKPNVNIVTVEDPVEKKIDGVNQCQINDKAGMTFAAALRSILRQDPDIVMVGEIRDGETADIAIRAAITGHLVLSTLHTNDAASTILRLVDMGVAPYMVASSLIGVIAQRLVKLLCPDCREKVLLTDPADLRLVGKTEPVEVYTNHVGGCRTCHNSGYRGRTAIHEIIVTSNDIKELIAKDATAEEIGAQAAKNGTKLLRSNVTDMVLAGTTTMDELVKATYSV